MKCALLAADASPASLRAAKLLGEMAARDPDLQVRVLHVVPLPEVLTPAAAAGAPLTLPGRLDDYVQTRVQEILQQTASALGIPADRIQSKHTIGVPAETILAEAKRLSADLIVMGRRGLSPLKELFLGSVSQEVLHKAQCPLILVP
jgi:nucleotide-binding universal stress UspA family protein